MLANNQRDQRLKFELLIPIEGDAAPTACASFNSHQDHFSGIWGIAGAEGHTARTGCVGFGLERMTLALLRHHGLNPAQWPAEVRGVLWP